MLRKWLPWHLTQNYTKISIHIVWSSGNPVVNVVIATKGYKKV
jgi:hypothetical protein